MSTDKLPKYILVDDPFKDEAPSGPVPAPKDGMGMIIVGAGMVGKTVYATRQAWSTTDATRQAWSTTDSGSPSPEQIEDMDRLVSMENEAVKQQLEIMKIHETGCLNPETGIFYSGKELRRMRRSLKRKQKNR